MCADCHRTQCEVDRRIPYTEEEKEMAIIIYLDGVGLRGVARILTKMDHKNFSTQTVMRWMAQAGQKIEQEELEF